MFVWATELACQRSLAASERRWAAQTAYSMIETLMKSSIVEVHVIPIRAPRKEAVRSGLNQNDPVSASEFGIIRIITESGLEGLGEISITFPRIGHSLCHAASQLIAPALIGFDSLARPKVLERVDRLLAGELSAPYIRAAFEMALLDLAGKHCGAPVYELLGGRMRDHVPLAWGIYQKSPEEMAADAVAGVEAGFHAIKLKVGRALDEDVAAVRAVATAVGRDIPLRLDANGAWLSVAEAARAIKAFVSVATIAWIEQPLARHDLDGLRLLRQRTPVPIMADESCQSLRDAYNLARAQAADVFNVYVVEAGGLEAAAAIFAFGDAVGIPCILGSQAEMGIGTAACAHLGVAVRHLPYACETFGPLRYCSDYVAHPIPISGGFLTPPDGPGLGVSLDMEAVAKMRV
jgi:L-alanine-DL-glutamate epimerase-like enolase superfamily enzyme